MAEGITDIMDMFGDISDDVEAGNEINAEDAKNLNEKLKSQGLTELSNDQMKEIANKMIDLSKQDPPNPADVTNTAEEISKILTGDDGEPTQALIDGVKNSLQEEVKNIEEDQNFTVSRQSREIGKAVNDAFKDGSINTPEGQAKLKAKILEILGTDAEAADTPLTKDASKNVLDSIDKTQEKVDPKDKGMWQKIKDDIAENWGKYTLVSVIIIIGSIIAADEWKKYKDARSGCFVTKTDSNGKVISHCKVMSLTCGDGSSDTSQACDDTGIDALKCNSTSSNVTGCQKAIPTTIGSGNNSLACSAGTIQDGFASIYCDDQYITTSDGTYTYHFHADENSGPIADLWNDFTKFFDELAGDLGDLLAWLKKWGTYIGIGLAVIIGIWVIYSLYSHFSGGGSEKVEFVSAPAPAQAPANHFRARTRMNNY
jgi:hypothetical protein